MPSVASHSSWQKLPKPFFLAFGVLRPHISCTPCCAGAHLTFWLYQVLTWCPVIALCPFFSQNMPFDCVKDHTVEIGVHSSQVLVQRC